MLTIHKYLLPPHPDTVLVDMPERAEILHVREQGLFIAVWALVNTDEKMKSYKFHVVETGKEAPRAGYRGTAIFERPSGTYVLHVFVDVGWPA